MTAEAWRKAALTHYLWVLEKAGPEYVMHAADEAEKHSEGVLRGLGVRVRAEIVTWRSRRAST